MQIVTSSAIPNTALQKYSGHEALLLEVFGSQVTQYISKPFTGIYQQCQNDELDLVFQLGNCSDNPAQQGTQAAQVGVGRLDKISGKLSLSEVQRVLNKEVKTTGNYVCQNLGYRYPSSVFYGNEAQ